MTDEIDTTSEVARVLRDHRIECTGLEGVTCRGCRELGWMSWTAYYGHQAKALAKSGLLRPQIAAQEPAGQPQADSGGRGASGGLGERLRALRQRFIGNAGEDDPNNDQDLVITGYAYWAVVQGLEAMAVEVDELETAYRVADAEIARLSVFHDHYRAQVEAIQAAIRREAAHGDAITRCNLVAERFQTVLDGAVGS